MSRAGSRGARLAGLVLALLIVHAQGAEPTLRSGGGREVGFAISGHQVADLDADGKDELVLLATDGRVRVLRGTTDGPLSEPLGDLTLPHPERSLVALGHVVNDERTYLFVASPDGVSAYPSVPDSGFASRPLRLARRARFNLRVGAPRFAEIVKELNGDGLSDVVIPRGDRCDIWLQGTAEDSRAPRLVRAAEVRVDVRRGSQLRGQALTDVLESTFSIPDVRVEDVNGDGRRDLLVSDDELRAFHLQREDGTFPPEPDVSVDLELFRDTTPQADVRLGRTLAGNDRQRYESRDLDGDGIPDHVIAHRRKVWVFLGGPAGPQFKKPVAILKTAEDVTALMLVRVDEDPLPDLVLVRLQVPTIATILRGLVAEWDVEMSAVGYRGRSQGGFDTDAGWNGELTVRLPALVGVIRDPDALIQKFEKLSEQFGGSVTADLNGDGRDDVVILDDETVGASRADAWLATASRQASDGDSERMVGEILFEDDERTWTLDRMLSFLGDLAQRRAARLTGGRPADGGIELRGDVDRRAVEALDSDGDGRAEIVVLYDAEAGAIVDVISWR